MKTKTNQQTSKIHLKNKLLIRNTKSDFRVQKYKKIAQNKTKCAFLWVQNHILTGVDINMGKEIFWHH